MTSKLRRKKTVDRLHLFPMDPFVKSTDYIKARHRHDSVHSSVEEFEEILYFTIKG